MLKKLLRDWFPNWCEHGSKFRQTWWKLADMRKSVDSKIHLTKKKSPWKHRGFAIKPRSQTSQKKEEVQWFIFMFRVSRWWLESPHLGGHIIKPWNNLKHQWLFLVPIKGGLGSIQSPIGRKNTTYISLTVLAFWGILCYLSPTIYGNQKQPLKTRCFSQKEIGCHAKKLEGFQSPPGPG